MSSSLVDSKVHNEKEIIIRENRVENVESCISMNYVVVRFVLKKNYT